MNRGKVIAAIAAALVFALGAPTTSVPVADGSPVHSPARAEDRVAQAITDGPAAVRRLLDEAAAGDFALATAVVKQAIVSSTTTAEPDSGGSPSATTTGTLDGGPAKSGCHGPVSSKTTISIVGINLGWRKATVNHWCWNASRVTSRSVSHDEWSGFGYCWKSESATNTWLVYPERLKYRNKGTLAGIAPWGCSGGQQTIAPSVHYERGGGWNVYGND